MPPLRIVERKYGWAVLLSGRVALGLQLPYLRCLLVIQFELSGAETTMEASQPNDFPQDPWSHPPASGKDSPGSVQVSCENLSFLHYPSLCLSIVDRAQTGELTFFGFWQAKEGSGRAVGNRVGGLCAQTLLPLNFPGAPVGGGSLPSLLL